jgi:hypothetical protein
LPLSTKSLRVSAAHNGWLQVRVLPGCRAEAHRAKAGARSASYGLASHAAIINGKDSRKGRRGSGFQLKYRKQPHAK